MSLSLYTVYRYITASPAQPRKGWPHHRDLRPLHFSNNGVGSFKPP